MCMIMWLIAGLIIIFLIILPLLIYTFLVFPNLDGVIQDLSWYNYDKDSQHYLFWFGFWMIFYFGTRSATHKYESEKRKNEMAWQK